jgi:DNA polymerase-3 subunit delta'
MMTWNMLGHEWAVELLQGQIKNDALRHAYLITGPAGIGRRTLALRFAQAINCSEPPEPGQACQQCTNCKQIAREQHPDMTVVQADEVGGRLKVEKVREMMRSLQLAPYQANYRIAVILRFEEANASAANALLKALEEPNPRVILLLTAERGEDLLPTISSRCEIMRLRPLKADALTAGLSEMWGIPGEDANLLAHLSSGRPGYAHYLHHNPEALEQRQIWLDEHIELLYGNRVTRFAYAETMAKDKPVFRAAVEVWISLWRDLMLLAGGQAARLTNMDRQEQLTALISTISLGTAKDVIGSLEKARRRMDQNVNLRLTAENLMLDLPFL